MNTKVQPRFGIVAVASVMLLLNLANITGPVSAKLYVLYWGYIAYLAYKGDCLSIFSWVRGALWIAGVAGLAAIAFGGDFLIFLTTGLVTKEALLFSLGLPIVVKVVLLIYLHGEVDEDSKKSAVSSTPDTPEQRKVVTPQPAPKPTPSSSVQSNIVVLPASDEPCDVKVEQAPPLDTVKTDNPKVFSSEKLMSAKPIAEAETKLLYDGTDPDAEQKILNRVNFSKDSERILSLIWIESDLSKRSRLIEQALSENYDGFLRILESNFEQKLDSLKFGDAQLKDSVVRILRVIQRTTPLKFDYAYSVALDLGDGLDVGLYKTTFLGDSILREVSQDKYDALVEKIFRRSPPGQELAEILNSIGFECSVVWSISGGLYHLKAKGSEYRDVSYEGLIALLREDVLHEEFIRLKVE